MPVRLAEADQMTIPEFLAFCEARPDGERWELIEGVAVLNPSPTEWHQRIAANITTALDLIKRDAGASWTALLGVGTRVPISPHSLPQPDVYVKSSAAADTSTTDDAVIVFEVLSKSNTKADQAWRKRVYASVRNCQHYVTVSTKRQEVVRYDRATGWQGVRVDAADAHLALPAIGAEIPLRDIYRWTPIS